MHLCILPARQDETIGRVTIPYVKRLSEQVAKVMKKHKIQTAHRPIQTIASTLHTKKKDKIHDLDKAGVVYYHKCKICQEDYVGETGRCWRERQCEHRLITHKEAKVSHTFKQDEENMTHNIPLIGAVRRSSRLGSKKQVDYNKLATGGEQFTTEGSTPLAQHVTQTHSKDDIETRLLTTKGSYIRRGIREALKIQEINPTLNQDDGRHQLSSIYTVIPKYSTRSRRLPKNTGALLPNNGNQNFTQEKLPVQIPVEAHLKEATKNGSPEHSSTPEEGNCKDGRKY